MNAVIEKYDTALKVSVAEAEKFRKRAVAKNKLLRRKEAEWRSALAEETDKKNKAIERKRSHQKRADTVEADLAAACSKIVSMGREMAILEEAAKVREGEHKRELNRLRRSRVLEVTK